jgi:hypothetical protein
MYTEAMENDPKDADVAGSGRMLSFRTSRRVEAYLEQYMEIVSRIEMQQIDRAEAGRRLLALGIRAWLAEQGTPANPEREDSGIFQRPK